MPFLASDPVANTVLLTEAHFWSRLSDPQPGARFGLWSEDGGPNSAFVHIPDHAPICSPLSPASIAELSDVLPQTSDVGVHAGDVAAVAATWRERGLVLRPGVRMTLLRLDDLRVRPLPAGAPRRAAAGDLPLLRSWFELFQERHPDDVSHAEFVVDHPLEEGGITLWELESEPVAMASRTPVVADMVRMGLAFQPTEGSTYADAAFAIGCGAAAEAAGHVLVLSGSRAATADYQSLGFAPVHDRVVLEVVRS